MLLRELYLAEGTTAAQATLKFPDGKVKIEIRARIASECIDSWYMQYFVDGELENKLIELPKHVDDQLNHRAEMIAFLRKFVGDLKAHAKSKHDVIATLEGFRDSDIDDVFRTYRKY